jgi:hypothetical protein
MQGNWKKSCIFFCLLIFAIVICLPPVFAQDAADNGAEDSAAVEPQPHHLVATYFHTTFRCPTCHNIENYSKATIHSNFADELQSGKLVWRVINVDELENKHFIKDYQLYSKHLIVSEVKDGKEVRWKDLKDVWTHVRNEEKFENYVKTEISDWLRE